MSDQTGPLMIDLAGPEISDAEIELLKHPMVGGVILFSRNFVSTDQLRHLNKQIKEASPRCMIAVDQEGGRVVRFKTGFSALQPMYHFGELYDKNPVDAFDKLRQQILLMSAELQSVGVDFSFVPVLDLHWGVSSVIGDRSFHPDPVVVTSLAEVLIKALHTVSMPAIGKHFPGHGAIKEDTHLEMAEDPRPFDELSAADMQPFASLLAQLDGLMTAHVVYPAVDPLPASLSKHWCQDVLRQSWHFDGLIFTDDLSMKGLAHVGPIEQCAQMALKAGADMLLVCNDRSAVESLLDKLPKQFIDPQRDELFRRRLHHA